MAVGSIRTVRPDPIESLATERPDSNDSPLRSPAGLTRGPIFAGAKMDRRVKHGDDCGAWVRLLGTHCRPRAGSTRGSISGGAKMGCLVEPGGDAGGSVNIGGPLVMRVPMNLDVCDAPAPRASSSAEDP